MELEVFLVVHECWCGCLTCMQGLNVDLPALVEKMKISIPLQDRKFLGKSFEKSFNGKYTILVITTPSYHISAT
jgi:hypothetical protein